MTDTDRTDGFGPPSPLGQKRVDASAPEGRAVAAIDARLEQIIALAVRDASVACDAEIARLRAALRAVAAQRRFGLCWCQTVAGLYCVGQPQCREARAALGMEEGDSP